MSEDLIRKAADEIDALLAHRLSPNAYLEQAPAIQEIAATLSRLFGKGETAQRFEANLLNFAKDWRIKLCEMCLRQAMADNFVVHSSALPAAPASPSPAEPLPLLPFACDKCGVQQHADGICANCGSKRLRRQEDA